MYTRIKTPDEIDAMRTSGRMLATVLQTLKSSVQPGVTAKRIDEIAAAELRMLGGVPAFLGYHGFPAVICVSVNDEVVHGIPRPETVFQDGDIVSPDFGVSYKGMITDSAISVLCGTGSQPVKDLLKYTESSMLEGIGAVRNDCHVGDIGSAVQNVLDKKGYGIVRDLVGHGVGHAVHEDPNIPNYGRKGTGPKLVSGMTIAIEPMATLGREAVTVDSDGWTVRTADGSLAAHFEHTVLVTDESAEILTSI